jgi:hypothetical protein
MLFTDHSFSGRTETNQEGEGGGSTEAYEEKKGKSPRGKKTEGWGVFSEEKRRPNITQEKEKRRRMCGQEGRWKIRRRDWKFYILQRGKEQS